MINSRPPNAIGKGGTPTLCPTQIYLFIYVEDKAFRFKIEENIQFLTLPVYSTEFSEWISFKPIFSSSERELGARMLETIFDKNQILPIILSDQFLSPSEDSLNSYDLTPFATALLDGFYYNSRLCTLMAISNSVGPKISGISVTYSKSHWNPEGFRKAILQAAERMLLLAPPSAAQLAKVQETELNIRVVGSEEEMRDVFSLRHRIYGLAGYLHETLSQAPQRMEMDYFDARAVQLIASRVDTGKTVGTHRLIIPHRPQGNIKCVLGSIGEIMAAQFEWYKRIALDFKNTPYFNRLVNPTAAPLPILQDLRPTENWKTLIKEAFSGVEVSRLVVSPELKGSGLARLLLRIGIATAQDLDKKFVLGEAIPSHLKMYQNFGFEVINSNYGKKETQEGIRVSVQKILGRLQEPQGLQGLQRSKMSTTAQGDLSLIKMAKGF